LDSYVKEFEVEESEHFLIIYSVTGLKNDEGTMAAVFARDRRHIFIGKRGGIFAYGRNSVKYKGWFKAMYFGVTS
jgi:hypothetical protein